MRPGRPGLVLERMISDRANPCLGSHHQIIHEQGRTWIHESYSRSAGRLREQSLSANRENCWDARVTRLHHSVARKRERDGSKKQPAGVISSRARLDSNMTEGFRREGSETMYVAPHAGEDMVRSA